MLLKMNKQTGRYHEKTERHRSVLHYALKDDRQECVTLRFKRRQTKTERDNEERKKTHKRAETPGG